MKTLLLGMILVSLIGMSVGVASEVPQKSLKHHQSWESWAIQGLYNDPRCPGQHPMYLYVEGAEGQFHKIFLECWGDRKNDAKY